ncbi:hypothetical protein ZIOFF_038353 [Zingiber officinale]|uniref:Dof zinc finger protein n=2 Tax=Zingiber officinale TaxID=94328 RepID=A0A8J5GEH3_ZINOF|nr:hypothetical protein ZIOFF_038353 [Zingiber officinale]
MLRNPAKGLLSPPFAEPEEHLRCPRCDSTDTKFCYFNNYNLSQPRHFCKSCRRYWTKGGALRNVPVGGGTHKNSKRSTSSSVPNSKRHHRAKAELISVLYPSLDVDPRLIGGVPNYASTSAVGAHGPELQSSIGDAAFESMSLQAALSNCNNFWGFQVDSECRDGAWPDLSTYINPGSGLQGSEITGNQLAFSFVSELQFMWKCWMSLEVLQIKVDLDTK